MSDRSEWSDEEWQLDQAVMDAEEVRPSGQVARLRAIREEWPKLRATVAALTAENERLDRLNAELCDALDPVGRIERALEAEGAAPDQAEGPREKMREIL